MPVNKVRKRGSYAPLSAHYYKDDAIIRAGERAEVLYVRSLAFCADVLNDGYISDAQLSHLSVNLSSVRGRVAKLVEVGLWERAPGGYYVRSWLTWNRSRNDILQIAKADSSRKSSQVSDDEPPPDPGDERAPEPSDSDRNPDGVRSGSHARRPARAPSKANSSSKSSSTPELPWVESQGESPPASDTRPAALTTTKNIGVARQVMADYVDRCTYPPARPTMNALTHDVHELVQLGWPTEVVGHCLDVWTSKAIAPSNFLSVAHETANRSAFSGTGRNRNQADDTVAWLQSQKTGTDGPQLRGIEGGKT